MQVYAWMEFQLLISGVLVTEVFDSAPNQTNKTKGQAQGNLSRVTTSNRHTQNKTKTATQHDNFDLNNIDCVPSNAKFFRCGAMPYIFDDNEAVIKMIIKGRSPTMRHVSRNHRVPLDWLFDRMNMDPSIQIKYVDTKHQLADILTKRNFTRDEWNNLLYLFKNQPFQLSLLRSEFQLDQLHQNDGEKDARAERREQDRGKVKADDEPGLACLDKFFDCAESDRVEKPGDTQSTLSNRLVKCKET